MRFNPFQLVSSGVLGVNYTSSVVDLQQVWVFSLQASWTGSPIGEFKLQASNDIIPVINNQDYPVTPPVVWTTISGSVNSTTALSSASYVWNIDSPAYRWVRLSYVASTATGVLIVNGLCKGV